MRNARSIPGAQDFDGDLFARRANVRLVNLGDDAAATGSLNSVEISIHRLAKLVLDLRLGLVPSRMGAVGLAGPAIALPIRSPTTSGRVDST